MTMFMRTKEHTLSHTQNIAAPSEQHERLGMEDKPEAVNALGQMRSVMLDRVNNIRNLQLEMFKEHMELLSQPGPDVAFGVPDESSDSSAPVGEASGRFKPLGEWFDAKEKGIQRLTDKLEQVCSEMQQLNFHAASHITGEIESLQKFND